MMARWKGNDTNKKPDDADLMIFHSDPEDKTEDYVLISRAQNSRDQNNLGQINHDEQKAIGWQSSLFTQNNNNMQKTDSEMKKKTSAESVFNIFYSDIGKPDIAMQDIRGQDSRGHDQNHDGQRNHQRSRSKSCGRENTRLYHSSLGQQNDAWYKTNNENKTNFAIGIEKPDIVMQNIRDQDSRGHDQNHDEQRNHQRSRSKSCGRENTRPYHSSLGRQNDAWYKTKDENKTNFAVDKVYKIYNTDSEDDVVKQTRRSELSRQSRARSKSCNRHNGQGNRASSNTRNVSWQVSEIVQNGYGGQNPRGEYARRDRQRSRERQTYRIKSPERQKSVEKLIRNRANSRDSESSVDSRDMNNQWQLVPVRSTSNLVNVRGGASKRGGQTTYNEPFSRAGNDSRGRRNSRDRQNGRGENSSRGGDGRYSPDKTGLNSRNGQTGRGGKNSGGHSNRVDNIRNSRDEQNSRGEKNSRGGHSSRGDGRRNSPDGKNSRVGYGSRSGQDSRGGQNSRGALSSRGGYDSRGAHNSRDRQNSRGAHSGRMETSPSRNRSNSYSGQNSRGGHNGYSGQNSRGGYNSYSSGPSYSGVTKRGVQNSHGGQSSRGGQSNRGGQNSYMSEVKMPSGDRVSVTVPVSFQCTCRHQNTNSKLVPLRPDGRMGKREFSIVSEEMRVNFLQGGSSNASYHVSGENAVTRFMKIVASEVKNATTFRTTGYQILTIEKIENCCTWKRFRNEQKEVAREAGYVNEKMLFHGSLYVDEIVRSGFDEQRDYIDGLLGPGVYFAQNASTSNHYVHVKNRCPRHSEKNCLDCYRKLLLCRVTLGKIYSLSSPHKTPYPPTGFHSMCGAPTQAEGQPCPEYIVYKGDQVYPEYLITYQLLP